jgi:hypothetical protein
MQLLAAPIGNDGRGGEPRTVTLGTTATGGGSAELHIQP